MTDKRPDPGPQQALMNSATLIMGASGTGKSSLIATLAEYVWEHYQKVMLYYSCDGGGFPTQVQALINRGIIRVWRMRTRSGDGLAFESGQRAAQGWWPKKINPRTGETDPNVDLVPPMTETYQMFCPTDHLVKTVAFASRLTPSPCPTCGTMVNKQNMHVKRSVARTKGFEQVGAAAYDGLSSMCSWMLTDLSHRTGKNELGGEKGALGGVVLSGEMAWGQNNRAQVGFTQNRAEQLALSSIGIPGLVVPPVWTALVHETTDEGGLNVRGPLIAGQAKTPVAPQWFGNCIEALVVEDAGKTYRRLQLQEFIDNTNTRHLCKTRSYPGALAEYLQEEDTGEASRHAFTQFNLGLFHQLLDQALVKTEERYVEQYPDAPGLPQNGDTVEYGEPATETAAQPAAKTTPAAKAKAAAQAKGAQAKGAPAAPPPTTPAPAAAAAKRAAAARVKKPAAAAPGPPAKSAGPGPKPPGAGPAAPPPGRRPQPKK